MILCGTWARSVWSDDYPFGWTDEEWWEFERFVRGRRGKPARDAASPGAHDDEAFRDWYATLMRQGASPRAILLLGEMSRAVDVRSLLPSVAVPTLVMHRIGDRVVEVGNGRYLAEQVPNARWVELAGTTRPADEQPRRDSPEMKKFSHGSRDSAQGDKIVATVMFTDVVGFHGAAEPR